jgi:hypothetical protein
LFEGVQKPHHHIDAAKMREIAIHVNLHPSFVMPHMLEKYPVPKKESPGLQIA